MPQAQENARAFIVIALIFWLITSPADNGGLIGIPSLTAARLERQRQAHGILNSTRWGDFSPRLGDDQADATPRYLNLTGFREQDGFAWEDLGRFRDRCTEWSRHAHGSSGTGENLWDLGIPEPTWQNVTGVVHGEWVRRAGSVERQASSYNLSEITSTVPWMGPPAEWSHNVTGQHGKMVLHLNDKDKSVEYEDRDGDGRPRSGGLARAISATVTLQDEATSSSSWDMKFHGVHWPRQGVILLTSTSEKFAGIFALPHLTLGPSFFYSSQTLLNETLDAILTRKERTKFSDPTNPWSASLEPEGQNWAPAPHCEYILYAQVHPLSPQQLGVTHFGDKSQDRLGLPSLVEHIENELRNPTGAPVKEYPELRLSTVMWSPDCSYFLESKGPPVFASVEGNHLTGKKEELLVYDGRMWLLAFAAIFFGQVYLLKAQMRESSTPSTVGRVSFYTAGIMLLADGLMFASASAWSLSAGATLLPSLLVTFSAFLSMALGGVFLGDVYRVQEPERRNRQREQAAANPTPTPPASAAAAAAAAATARAAATTTTTTSVEIPLVADSLPRPVTAPPLRPATPPIIIPSDQDIDAEIAENAAAGAAAVPLPPPGTRPTTAAAQQPSRAQPQQPTSFSSISGRFILLGTFLLFVSLAATSWPARVRAAYANALAGVYFSLWVPQIYRNVMRNSRRAYGWRFMVGQSVLRAAPLAYFYLCEDNVLFAAPDPVAFAVLAAWLWVQLWVLALQDVLGPRYGIPKGWVPEAWDYHPVLREDNLEAGGLPIGLVGGGGGGDSEPGSPVVASTRRVSVGEGSKSERDRGKGRAHIHEIDCAICRETLEVPVVPAGADPDAVGAGGSVAATLARRTYMVTPCRHIFHSACLEGWLRFRLQCPICREELPPL